MLRPEEGVMEQWLQDLTRLSAGEVVRGIAIGVGVWFVLRCLIFGFYTVDQNERAVITTFGRAQRLLGASTVMSQAAEGLRDDERERYHYPQVRVVGPGGPYFKWPWQVVHKVSVATQTVNMAWDPEDARANHGGTMLEAVTKDQLNTGVVGQIRYRVSAENLYAYLFGVKRPIAHVMGFFVSILRERIASFEAPQAPKPPPASSEALVPVSPTALVPASEASSEVTGVSINDLRKNLRALNEHMDRECAASTARYGITLDASLITEIHSPPEVESALAAINTAHNQVASDISLARAGADQKIVQSRRAVEIETLRAQTEVEPLEALASQLTALKQSGPEALPAYLRNVRLGLYNKADRVVVEVKS
jgi:regulator of protease activity HflC (stomatin/prohibitin superfamily)